METTLVVKVGYRGGAFAGYAEQEGQRTVAGELRYALETLFRRSCELTCAGRTDEENEFSLFYIDVYVLQTYARTIQFRNVIKFNQCCASRVDILHNIVLYLV